MPTLGLSPPAVARQSRLKIPLGAADIEVMTALKGKTPKAPNGYRSGTGEAEDREVNAAVHGEHHSALASQQLETGSNGKARV